MNTTVALVQADGFMASDGFQLERYRVQLDQLDLRLAEIAIQHTH